MSTITEKKKDGKVVAFKFTTYVGKDDQGKQKYKTTTWKPLNGLSKTTTLFHKSIFRKNTIFPVFSPSV